MPSRYEWATIAGPTADIVDADELRDIADARPNLPTRRSAYAP